MNELTNKKDMIKYLECVKNLEISLYNLSRANTIVSEQIHVCEAESVYNEKKFIGKPFQKKTSIIDRIFTGLIGAFIGGLITLIILVIIVNFKIVIEHPWALWNLVLGRTNYYKGQFSVCIKWSKIVAVICMAISMFIFPSKRSIKKVNNEIAKENSIKSAEIAKENLWMKEKAEKAKRKAKIYIKELDIIDTNFQKVKGMLNQYYDLGFIYPKYRKLVYICSIYEYFESGICDTLTGPSGAYSLLELDIKYSKINDKLDTISDKIDEVIKNQRQLYKVMSECNSNIAKLSRTLDEMASIVA